jgi:CHASE3 domain sensor protein
LIDYNTKEYEKQRQIHQKFDEQQKSSTLLDDRGYIATQDDFERHEWEKQAHAEVQRVQRRHQLHKNEESLAKQTASAREHVKKIRKQQKTKVQRRIAKIKQRAAENTGESLTDRIMNLNDE